ncbi:hypothetical protein F1737_04140 [Methanoplanus sp. FWC-SCC4]|uniref:Uncharacterized protein n=1 Tax=Methanochimaera problematica TaxID=2609417 RepID=A0AA97I272_9EURY|nr:hypothetical protein [Methanoplanus sp. FWC-SCC4]WOF15945.1 hypothetical protein F1737_04140 [Methanoplanus sp. FWC-SCC4]
MDKNKIKIMLILSAVICIAAGTAAFEGLIETWIGAAFLVVFFPAFVITLGLWWKASEKEGDYPFIGY